MLYAQARAAGQTQAAAILAAGGSHLAPSAFSKAAQRLEARPEVAELIAAAKTDIRELAMAGLRQVLPHVLAIATRKAPKTTNRDVCDAAQLVGRFAGAFDEGKSVVEFHVVMKSLVGREDPLDVEAVQAPALPQTSDQPSDAPPPASEEKPASPVDPPS